MRQRKFLRLPLFVFFVATCLSLLAQVQNSGVITGRILSPDGTPAAGVRVAAIEVSTAAVPATAALTLASLSETDADGRFRLENLPPGRYHVSAGLVEFPTYHPGTATLDQALTVTVAAESVATGVDFRLVRPDRVRVAGRIVGMPDPSRLVGSVILSGTAGSFRANVNASGAFEFERVAPGEYTVRPATSAAGIFPVRVVASGSDLENVELSVSRTFTVDGRITTDDGVLPRIQLTLENAAGASIAGTMTVRPDGTFTATLPGGTHRATIRGYSGNYVLKRFAHGPTDLLNEPLNITQTRSFPLDIAFGAAPSARWFAVSGRVVGDVPQVQAGARVVLTVEGFAGQQATVNSDGTFTFPKVPPGTHALTLEKPGTRPRTATIEVKDQDLAGIELFAERGVTVGGDVVTEGGTPIRSVSLHTEAGITVNVSVPASGAFLVPLTEGEYRLRVSGFPAFYEIASFTAGAANLLEEPLRVSAGNPPRLSLKLRPSDPAAFFRITGRLTGRDIPLLAPGSQNVVLTGAGLTLQSPIAPDRSFELLRVPPGRYVARVPAMAGSLSVTLNVVDKDLEGVELPIERLFEVDIIPRVEGGWPLPSFAFEISRIDATSRTVGPGIEANGTRRVRLPEGTYSLAVTNASAGYYVRAMTSGAADLLGNSVLVSPETFQPIEITFATTAAARWVRVSGRVTADSSMPAAEAKRVVISGGPAHQRFETAAASDGTFEFPNLLPGSYTAQVVAGEFRSQPMTIAVGDYDVNGVALP